MTIGLGFIISICDYVNGNSDKSLDEITDKILSKVHPRDLEDFFAMIALFSSRNSRFQELKANCEAQIEMNRCKVVIQR